MLIRELAQALADRGHEVHVVTYPFAESLVPIRGLFVHRARVPLVRRWPRKLGWRKVVLDAALCVLLYRVVRRERIEVMHAHNYEGPLVALLVRWLTGVPIVYHSHNALGDELAYYFRAGVRRRVAACVGRMLDRLIPRRADFSIALTPELARLLRACGVAANRLAVVSPGALAAAFPEAGTPDPFEGRFVVMYTGNVDPYQDLGVLFEAFATFSKGVDAALLVVVTHDPEWSAYVDARLHELIRDGRARVVVASAFAVVRRLLGRAEVLVCPRSSWSGFPIKLANYMAAGKAVVVADGSAKTVVDGQTGLTFANGDTAALAAALSHLWHDPPLRHRLGEGARGAIGRLYSWKRAVSRIEQIYAQVAQPVSDSRDLATGTARRLAGIDSVGLRSYKPRGQQAAGQGCE